MNRPAQQSGAALIMVLLALALLTFTSVNIGDQMRFSIARLSNQLNNDQAWWYALGAEDLSRAAISVSKDEATSHLEQPWASENTVFPIDGGLITGSIRDQQSCFNLNRLHRPENSADDPNALSLPAKQFERLAVLAGYDDNSARSLRERVQDWIDSDQIPTGYNGAEDLTYTALQTPYLTPNQLMLAESEINLLITGMEPLPADLETVLCALPATDTTLNVNTVTRETAAVLAAMLGPEFSVEDASRLIEQRPDKGWNSVDNALAGLGERAASVDTTVRKTLSVKSDWFIADITVQHFNGRLRVLSRFTAEGDTVVSYARSYGELF